jgi:hypothetical protein
MTGQSESLPMMIATCTTAPFDEAASLIDRSRQIIGRVMRPLKQDLHIIPHDGHMTQLASRPNLLAVQMHS